MTIDGQPWPAMASYGQIWPAMACHGWLWPVSEKMNFNLYWAMPPMHQHRGKHIFLHIQKKLIFKLTINNLEGYMREDLEGFMREHNYIVSHAPRNAARLSNSDLTTSAGVSPLQLLWMPSQLHCSHLIGLRNIPLPQGARSLRTWLACLVACLLACLLPLLPCRNVPHGMMIYLSSGFAGIILQAKTK